VLEGIQRGDDSVNLKKFLMKSANLPEARAKLIAVDQTQKLFSNLSQQRQTDIGVERYFWRNVGDGAVRDEDVEFGEMSDRGITFRWDN
jgi:uncharacterized protein with gpF-like domain